MRRLFAFVALLVVLFPSGLALADDAALGRRGETVYPISSHHVRMVAEEVRLTVRPRETLVDVTFTFQNGGPAHDVLMGFPVGRPGNEERGDFELYDFRTWVDGKEVTAVREKGVRPIETPAGEDFRNLSYPAWFTWTVGFGPGETHTVRNTYRARNYYTSNGFAGTGYILQTGKVWRGTIGSAVVRVAFDGVVVPAGITGASPASYRWEGESMVWRFQEFEPTRDVKLIFRVRDDVTNQEQPNQSVSVKRYLMDKAGLEGSAPEAPRVSADGTVVLADPDGDLDDWGLAVYTSPDTSLNPLTTAGGLENLWESRTEWQLHMDALPWKDWSEVWYQAWAMDGRGHRTETGWVKLVMREPAAAQPAAPEPEPHRPAARDVRQHDWAPWVLLGLMLSVSIGYVIVRREK